MLKTSVYTGGRPARFLRTMDVIGHDQLTPKLAKLILSELGHTSGTVFCDGITLPNGDYGIVWYRVYESGRCRRHFAPLLQTSFAEIDMPF